MIIKPFETDHLPGVIACIRRNFGWMSQVSENDVSDWVCPILTYKWREDTAISNQEYKYDHGAVLLDGEKIVGFFGMIMSRRIIGSQKRVIGSPTVWAIDEGYRFHFYEVLNEILDSDVNWIELTPRKSVAEALKMLYGFQMFGNRQFRLIPMPVKSNMCEVRYISDECEVENEIIRREFIDHQSVYGVRLARIASISTDEVSYAFFKTFNEGSTRIRFLKISNSSLFADNCSEIIWKIYKSMFYPEIDASDILVKIMDGLYNREKLCVECDDFLLGNKVLNHPLIKEKEVTRLCRPMDFSAQIDLLYTEYALLSSRI